MSPLMCSFCIETLVGLETSLSNPGLHTNQLQSIGFPCISDGSTTIKQMPYIPQNHLQSDLSLCPLQNPQALLSWGAAECGAHEYIGYRYLLVKIKQTNKTLSQPGQRAEEEKCLLREKGISTSA